MTQRLDEIAELAARLEAWVAKQTSPELEAAMEHHRREADEKDRALRLKETNDGRE